MTHVSTGLARPAHRWTTTIDGRHLRNLRHRHGLSQEQLAGKAGISVATIARLEQGHHHAPCRSRTLARLAAALGHPPADLTPAPRPETPASLSETGTPAPGAGQPHANNQRWLS